jgi:hypothetical protein
MGADIGKAAVAGDLVDLRPLSPARGWAPEEDGRTYAQLAEKPSQEEKI